MNKKMTVLKCQSAHAISFFSQHTPAAAGVHLRLFRAAKTRAFISVHQQMHRCDSTEHRQEAGVFSHLWCI